MGVFLSTFHADITKSDEWFVSSLIIGYIYMCIYISLSTINSLTWITEKKDCTANLAQMRQYRETKILVSLEHFSLALQARFPFLSIESWLKGYFQLLFLSLNSNNFSSFASLWLNVVFFSFEFPCWWPTILWFSVWWNQGSKRRICGTFWLHAKVLWHYFCIRYGTGFEKGSQDPYDVDQMLMEQYSGPFSHFYQMLWFLCMYQQKAEDSFHSK